MVVVTSSTSSQAQISEQLARERKVSQDVEIIGTSGNLVRVRAQRYGGGYDEFQLEARDVVFIQRNPEVEQALETAQAQDVGRINERIVYSTPGGYSTPYSPTGYAIAPIGVQDPRPVTVASTPVSSGPSFTSAEAPYTPAIRPVATSTTGQEIVNVGYDTTPYVQTPASFKDNSYEFVEVKQEIKQQEIELPFFGVREQSQEFVQEVYSNPYITRAAGYALGGPAGFIIGPSEYEFAAGVVTSPLLLPERVARTGAAIVEDPGRFIVSIPEGIVETGSRAATSSFFAGQIVGESLIGGKLIGYGSKTISTGRNIVSKFSEFGDYNVVGKTLASGEYDISLSAPVRAPIEVDVTFLREIQAGRITEQTVNLPGSRQTGVSTVFEIKETGRAAGSVRDILKLEEESIYQRGIVGKGDLTFTNVFREDFSLITETRRMKITELPEMLNLDDYVEFISKRRGVRTVVQEPGFESFRQIDIEVFAPIKTEKAFAPRLLKPADIPKTPLSKTFTSPIVTEITSPIVKLPEFISGPKSTIVQTELMVKPRSIPLRFEPITPSSPAKLNYGFPEYAYTYPSPIIFQEFDNVFESPTLKAQLNIPVQSSGLKPSIRFNDVTNLRDNYNIKQSTGLGRLDLQFELPKISQGQLQFKIQAPSQIEMQRIDLRQDQSFKISKLYKTPTISFLAPKLAGFAHIGAGYRRRSSPTSLRISAPSLRTYKYTPQVYSVLTGLTSRKAPKDITGLKVRPVILSSSKKRKGKKKWRF